MMDRNDIEQLFKTHYAQMHRLARMYVHDDNLSHDIVQDVFASCLHRTKAVSYTHLDAADEL